MMNIMTTMQKIKNNNENCQVFFLYNEKKTTTKLGKKNVLLFRAQWLSIECSTTQPHYPKYFHNLFWDAVEDNEKNGKILSYKITYAPFNRKNSPRTINVTAPIVHTNLTQLGSYRRYNITVLSSNVHGDGPSSDSVIVRTVTSSKYG